MLKLGHTSNPGLNDNPAAVDKCLATFPGRSRFSTRAPGAVVTLRHSTIAAAAGGDGCVTAPSRAARTCTGATRTRSGPPPDAPPHEQRDTRGEHGAEQEVHDADLSHVDELGDPDAETPVCQACPRPWPAPKPTGRGCRPRLPQGHDADGEGRARPGRWRARDLGWTVPFPTPPRESIMTFKRQSAFMWRSETGKVAVVCGGAGAFGHCERRRVVGLLHRERWLSVGALHGRVLWSRRNG